MVSLSALQEILEGKKPTNRSPCIIWGMVRVELFGTSGDWAFAKKTTNSMVRLYRARLVIEFVSFGLMYEKLVLGRWSILNVQFTVFSAQLIVHCPPPKTSNLKPKT